MHSFVGIFATDSNTTFTLFACFHLIGSRIILGKQAAVVPFSLAVVIDDCSEVWDAHGRLNLLQVRSNNGCLLYFLKLYFFFECL